MAPLPKRRSSSRRQGKRENANMRISFAVPNVCPKCSKPKLPHRACPSCGFYK